jgi:stage III sporulation protein SpoIIIAA
MVHLSHLIINIKCVLHILFCNNLFPRSLKKIHKKKNQQHNKDTFTLSIMMTLADKRKLCALLMHLQADTWTEVQDVIEALKKNSNLHNWLASLELFDYQKKYADYLDLNRCTKLRLNYHPPSKHEVLQQVHELFQSVSNDLTKVSDVTKLLEETLEVQVCVELMKICPSDSWELNRSVLKYISEPIAPGSNTTSSDSTPTTKANGSTSKVTKANGSKTNGKANIRDNKANGSKSNTSSSNSNKANVNTQKEDEGNNWNNNNTENNWGGSENFHEESNWGSADNADVFNGEPDVPSTTTTTTITTSTTNTSATTANSNKSTVKKKQNAVPIVRKTKTETPVNRDSSSSSRENRQREEQQADTTSVHSHSSGKSRTKSKKRRYIRDGNTKDDGWGSSNGSTNTSTTLINDYDTLQNAMLQINYENTIAVDCEGTSTGRFGKLCLVQIATRNNQYIFDLLVDDSDVYDQMMEFLRELLESDNIKKIFHDCRQDSGILFTQYDIHLRNVYDCQPVYALLCKVQNRTIQAQVTLNELCRAYGYAGKANKAAEHCNWDVRPMTTRMIQIAASAVQFLVEIHEKMMEEFEHSYVETISDVSRRYVEHLIDSDSIISESFRAKLTKDAELKPVDIIRDSEVDPIVFQVKNESDKLLAVLPQHIADRIRSSLSEERINMLTEFVMDSGRPFEMIFREDRVDLTVSDDSDELVVVTEYDIQNTAYQLRFGQDNRAGINETLHRISAIHNRDNEIVGLTLRIGRAVIGLSSLIRDILKRKESILFLGHPGSGKTTVIRDVARYMADKYRVIIVDTSCEIGGFGNLPHKAVGRSRRMQVQDIKQQQQVMIQAVQNHTPEIIIIDEIGTKKETLAARTISQRGVTVFASAHGDLPSILKNPEVSDLLGGVETVILGDEASKRTKGQKLQQQLRHDPIFTTVIELSPDELCSWTVYSNVKETAKSILAGTPYHRERRTFDEESGEVIITREVIDPQIGIDL